MMPKDKKKQGRDKAKPYAKDGQQSTETHDSDEQTATCCVCEGTIKEPVDDQPGDEAVYCEGGCAAWFHRKCAGLSRSAYINAGESELPFYCVFCMQSAYKKEITELKEQISSLASKITKLLESLQSQNMLTQPSHLTTVTNVSQTPPPKSDDGQTIPRSNTVLNDGRKYNIILYGLKECEKGTKRPIRMKEELEQVTQILTATEKSVGPQSIRDCFRLGKYSESSKRPRPVLVKLSRSYDVSSILSNRQFLPKDLTIKPDLPPAERAVESLLMKERWQLIQSGQNKKDIKIYGNKLLLKGNLYGTVANSEFVRISPSNAAHQSTSNITTSQSSTMDTGTPDN